MAIFKPDTLIKLTAIRSSGAFLGKGKGKGVHMGGINLSAVSAAPLVRLQMTNVKPSVYCIYLVLPYKA